MRDLIKTLEILEKVTHIQEETRLQMIKIKDSLPGLTPDQKKERAYQVCKAMLSGMNRVQELLNEIIEGRDQEKGS